jgi:hypothetical protein
VSINLISQEFIYNEALYLQSYSGSLSSQTIEEFLGFQSQFWWVGYIIIPIFILVKLLFASTCIMIGALFSDRLLKFKEIFKTVIIAEGIFIMAQILYLFILYSNLSELTLQNAAGFYPLSALSFVGIENVNAQWAIYPLQTVNLFEVFYVITISWLLSKNLGKEWIDTLNLVIPSYGLGLLLWVTFVAFLTLQFT